MILKKIYQYLKYQEKRSTKSFVKFLRKKGIKIGNNCLIYWPPTTVIDYQNPFLLEIGDNVKITEGVKILTHDFSSSVLANVYGEYIGSLRKTIIGNNVFIGIGTIILGGSNIGNNVIIGAGSVVSGNIESNSVYAGNPAKKICNIDELYKKRKSRELSDAKEIAIWYYQKTGKKANSVILREYQNLFSSRVNIPSGLNDIFLACGEYDKCQETYYKSKAKFESLDEFIGWCENNDE